MALNRFDAHGRATAFQALNRLNSDQVVPRVNPVLEMVGFNLLNSRRRPPFALRPRFHKSGLLLGGDQPLFIGLAESYLREHVKLLF